MSAYFFHRNPSVGVGVDEFPRSYAVLSEYFVLVGYGVMTSILSILCFLFKDGFVEVSPWEVPWWLLWSNQYSLL